MAAGALAVVVVFVIFGRSRVSPQGCVCSGSFSTGKKNYASKAKIEPLQIVTAHRFFSAFPVPVAFVAAAAAVVVVAVALALVRVVVVVVVAGAGAGAGACRCRPRGFVVVAGGNSYCCPIKCQNTGMHAKALLVRGSGGGNNSFLLHSLVSKSSATRSLLTVVWEGPQVWGSSTRLPWNETYSS